MGLVYVDGVVKHDGKSVGARFLVDSGAMYTVLTRGVWEELGLKPMGEMEFVLADGTVIRRAISEAVLELPGYGERHTPVVLGESEDENLLGVVTLEIFGLVLDPFRRELRPARGLIKAVTEARSRRREAATVRRDSADRRWRH
ncbi:MAG: aspartyl protease family protein [Thermoproteus sp.]